MLLQGRLARTGENLLTVARGKGALKPVDLIFEESTYVKLEVDLEAKCQCSDDIFGAECSAESEWLRALTEQNPYDSFEGYLHFRIDLVPRGGAVNILAKGFSLEPPVSG